MNIFLSSIKFLIKFFVIFMIFFIWLRYYMNAELEALLLSALCAIILLLILHVTGKGRKNMASMKNKERQEAEGMFESLIKNKDYQFFFSLVSSRHKNVSKRRIFTLLENENGKILLYPFLKMKPLEIDDLLSICSQAKKVKADKLVISAKEVSKEAENFASTLKADILLLDQYATYEYLFKEYDFYPEFERAQTKSKRGRFKEVFDYSFDRARAKGYIISALVLLLITFLFRQSLYYSIVATVLLAFALICLIRNPKSKKITKQIL